MPLVGGPDTRITNPRWRTAAILEKSKNRYISVEVFTDFDEIWRADAARPSWPSRPLKIWNFKIQDGGGRHFEKSKTRHISAAIWPIWQNLACWNFKNPRWRRPPFGKNLGRSLTDFDEIWRADAARTSWPSRPLKIWNFKIQDGGGRHFEKSKNRHISAALRAILTKFGVVTHLDPLDRSER